MHKLKVWFKYTESKQVNLSPLLYSLIASSFTSKTDITCYTMQGNFSKTWEIEATQANIKEIQESPKM